MQRRDLLRKIGLGVFMLPAMVGTLSAEPKPDGVEMHVAHLPSCPECGMCFDTSYTDGKGRRVFMHPEKYAEGSESEGKWRCKAAGKKFYLPTQQLEEYHGEMKRGW